VRPSENLPAHRRQRGFVEEITSRRD